ncbi:hypothetical protein JHK85_011402 [Glycine max]|nr:hypothetical protein JHK85_011402 [Glycine max]
MASERDDKTGAIALWWHKNDKMGNSNIAFPKSWAGEVEAGVAGVEEEHGGDHGAMIHVIVSDFGSAFTPTRAATQTKSKPPFRPFPYPKQQAIPFLTVPEIVKSESRRHQIAESIELRRPTPRYYLLAVWVLSLASKFSYSELQLWTVNIVQYKALPSLPEEFGSVLGRQVIKNKKLWGSIESLETLQPNANARSNYSVPKQQSNGFLYAKVFGGFSKIRSSSILPPSMAEIQRLRCRVAFHALQFRPEIQMLGRRMVHKLRALGQPFLAFHPGLLRETLAYNGCAELFQDVHTELIQHRRSRMIKEGVLKDELNVDSHLRREKGLCPIMPEEVGILLRVMGYPAKTIIYLAGSELFGGQRALIPLRSMFINTMDRTSLCSETEFSDLVGPETPLPVNSFRPPPAKSENELKEEWKKAGPRPRPLPPPPGRPIYQHEKEGWYAWITETPTEPDPSPMDLRMKAHRLLWDALDYIVSLEADAFFPGFNNDGSGWPDFSSLVMGHRLYETASFRTYRPDRKVVAELFNMTRENLYHPKHNWTVLVQEHLNRSLAEEGLIRQSLLSKPAMFLSHPLPECSCRIASTKATNRFRGENGQVLYGGEDICPKWMQHANDAGSLEKEGSKSEDEGLADYESNDFVDESESEKNGSKTNQTPLWDQDEEMDPND